jgi:phytoene dehydrogenase-like protein
MHDITIVGGGLGGLVAAITCAENGARVRLHEAHRMVGGRARTTGGPFHANLGPHVVYDDGPLWAWLVDRGLAGDRRAPLRGLRFRYRGELRRTPPAALIRGLKLLGKKAPVDRNFHSWVADSCGEDAADALSHAAGVFSFDADPGRLSAAFVWERLRRAAQVPPVARYIAGGWGTLVQRLERRARDLGVAIELGSALESLPSDRPVIVATELDAARRLLGDDTLRVEGARTALLDIGLERRRGEPFVVSDLDESGWVERFSLPDPSLAPEGHSLLQAQLGLRAAERLEDGVVRIERLLDLAFRDWRSREVWRRRSLVDGRSGALDLPGTTWRDRPAVTRGNGVFLVGDMVAAPGLLSEVSFNSAMEAAWLAVAEARGAPQSGGATTTPARASTGARESAGTR